MVAPVTIGPGEHVLRAVALPGLLLLVLLPATSAAPPTDLLDPVAINGDAELSSARGVRGGSGTQQDPYRIDGWRIDLYGTNQSGIRLENTTRHVLIRNVLVENGPNSVGLLVANASNVRLEAITSVANKYGMTAANVPGLTVRDSEFSGNVIVGALLDRVDGGIMERVTAARNAVGVRWIDSKGIHAGNLTLSENGRGADQQRPALHLLRVDGATLSGVKANDNLDDGLRMEDVKRIQGSDLAAELNRAAGLRVTTGDDVSITAIRARGNGGNGVTLESVHQAQVSDVRADLNQRNGIQFTGGSAAEFRSVTTERNSRHGLMATETVDGSFVDGVSQYNGGSGLMVVGHRNLVQRNTLYRNTDAKAALWLQGDSNVVRDNGIHQNSGWGIYIIVGRDNVVEQNRVDGNGQGDIYSGPAEGENKIANNEGRVRYFQTAPLPAAPAWTVAMLLWFVVRHETHTVRQTGFPNEAGESALLKGIVPCRSPRSVAWLIPATLGVYTWVWMWNLARASDRLVNALVPGEHAKAFPVARRLPRLVTAVFGFFLLHGMLLVAATQNTPTPADRLPPVVNVALWTFAVLAMGSAVGTMVSLFVAAKRAATNLRLVQMRLGIPDPVDFDEVRALMHVPIVGIHKAVRRLQQALCDIVDDIERRGTSPGSKRQVDR